MKNYKIKVKGIVQGVGFRPFVYKLALKYKLKGYVNNDASGVNIELSALEEDLNSFLKDLKEDTPILANITSLEVQELKTIVTFESFEIIKSVLSNNKNTMLSPDMSICKDCIDDINNSSNKRFNYALTNCTNCGPRYSIIKNLPYDRVSTSMSEFILCEACAKEYKDPSNRRYHAQPISCKNCGPKIKLYDNNNTEICKDEEAIKEIAKHVNNGLIVAIKGLGGFHLICDALNTQSIKTLREYKNRKDKPFAVMFENIKSIKEYANFSEKEEEVLNSKEKPIVLISKKQDSALSSLLAPNIDKIGCFLAYTPLHIVLFKHLNNPILATSANLAKEPIITSKDEIIEKLKGITSYILDFNREIVNACDDSVVQIVNNKLVHLRQARGYAPKSYKLDKKISKKILALGANQKSSIAIAFDDVLINSPYIADLESLKSLDYFKATIDTFKRVYDFAPDVIICDKHPSYESTKWAKKQNIELVQIQHHYAHVLSCMFEFKLKDEVLAFCFDGTGYGDDKKIWGGEVFIANKNSYKRVKHLKYFKLLGLEKAIKEPKRIALSLLFDSFTIEEVLKLSNSCVKAFKEKEIVLLHKMWKKSLNTVETSSIGRVFDAFASFADLCHLQTYEAQAGLLIEKYYDLKIQESYSYIINENDIDISLAIKEVVKDTNKNIICSKFINMIVSIILELSLHNKDLPIILCGGVFQNKTLLELVSKNLEKEKRTFYYNEQSSLNDESICLGQVNYLI